MDNLIARLKAYAAVLLEQGELDEADLVNDAAVKIEELRANLKTAAEENWRLSARVTALEALSHAKGENNV